MPPRLDRQPKESADRPMPSIELMKKLIRDVLTNRDGYSDSELVARLLRLKREGVTQTETVQIIEDFPPEEVSSSGKKWLLDFANRVYRVSAGRAPMKI